jgi:hypothetical protein
MFYCVIVGNEVVANVTNPEHAHTICSEYEDAVVIHGRQEFFAEVDDEEVCSTDA